MSYGPNDFWAIGDNLRPDMALAPGDPRYVDLGPARGTATYRSLYVTLQVNGDGALVHPKESQYILFAGHMGAGKSTELRRLAKALDAPERYFVVLLDALEKLDTQNLQYADVLLALAAELFDRLAREGIRLNPVHLGRLEDWFKQRVLTTIREKGVQSELKTGLEAKVDIPFLARAFASLTSAIKIGATYKDELRDVVRNTFSQFADDFNALIRAAEDALAAAGRGRRLLFVVDGTDRLKGQDTQDFFVDNVNQLKLVRSTFIYCAPIHILSENMLLQQRFDHTEKVPMVKLHEKDGKRVGKAYDALRDFVFRRVHPDLFRPKSVADILIEHSGGHPRDLVRLLNLARQEARAEYFDKRAAERAVDHLASDYRRVLEPGDYALLRDIDRNDQQDNSARVRFLLQNLAVLEYNSYWWRSHPSVRRLPGYRALE